MPASGARPQLWLPLRTPCYNTLAVCMCMCLWLRSGWGKQTEVVETLRQTHKKELARVVEAVLSHQVQYPPDLSQRAPVLPPGKMAQSVGTTSR